MLARHTTSALLVLVVAMIALGGIVHSTGSSLACPDWPTCYGEAMPAMEGGILFEHSHRMLGTLIGLATILLAFGLFRSESASGRLFAGGMASIFAQLGFIGFAVSQQAYMWLGFGFLALVALLAVLALLFRGGAKLTALGLIGLELVVVQGILGGLTVILRLPAAVSTVHLGIAMALLGGLTYVAFRLRADSIIPGDVAVKRHWLFIAAAALYLQIIVGALMRHTGSTLACGNGVFSCEGTMAGATHLALFHRWFAMAVAGLLIGASIPVLRYAKREGRGRLRALAMSVHGIVVVQIALGFLALVHFVPVSLATLHQVVAALLLVVQVAMYLAVGPMGRPQQSNSEATAPGLALGAH
jgi:heme A synthase